MKTIQPLKARALSARAGTVCSAIAEMISLGQFPLSDEDLAVLADRENEFISGWVFTYRVNLATPADKVQMLCAGLQDPHPRIREHSCDIIGDHGILELREKMESLFNDPNPDVAESATYNHGMLGA